MVDNHRREEPTALGIGDSHATTLLQWVSCVGYAPLYWLPLCHLLWWNGHRSYHWNLTV